MQKQNAIMPNQLFNVIANYRTKHKNRTAFTFK